MLHDNKKKNTPTTTPPILHIFSLNKFRLVFVLYSLLIASCIPIQMPETILAPTNTLASGNATVPAPTQTRFRKPSATTSSPLPSQTQTSIKPTKTSSQPKTGRLVTYVPSKGIGNIAVQIVPPQSPRYPEGAGVVVEISAFLTPGKGFPKGLDIESLGLIHITYLPPGWQDPSGVSSDGVDDYGGKTSIQALRDVIRFAGGQITDYESRYLADLIAVPPLSDEVGLYAFSHPGISAVNVLASYGKQIPQARYFVGRENPTLEALSAVEVGHIDDQLRRILNPIYLYPMGYSPTQITMDYNLVQWEANFHEPASAHVGRPYFDLNRNSRLDPEDYLLGYKVPTIYGKRTYSVALTRALLENGCLTKASWPSDLATPEETASWWPIRSSVKRYHELAVQTPNLKVMLVFARQDHVQPAYDKPHIHQAYDGFHNTAGLWIRLNPDSAYLAALNPKLGASGRENPANAEPVDWMQIESWAYPESRLANQLVALAAVAEMADRTHANVWALDLPAPLFNYFAAQQQP